MKELLSYAEDADDVHIPLLLWWAIEDKAIAETSIVLGLLQSAEVWHRPLVRKFIIPRISRRLAAEGTAAGFEACARLLALAPGEEYLDPVLSGMVEALSGRRIQRVPKPLETMLAKLLERRRSDARVIQLSLRLGGSPAPAVQLIDDASQPVEARLAMIRTLGETRIALAIEPLLRLIGESQSEQIQTAALAALAYFDEPSITTEIRSAYALLKPGAKPRAIDLLCSRPAGAATLLAAVEKREIAAKDVTLEQVRQLLEHDDEKLRSNVARIWGQVQPATPLQLQGRISAVSQLLNRGTGNPNGGSALYEKTCATCHKLHGRGTTIGPDLTGAERKDRLKLIRNIVDPNAEIRPQYISHIAVTNDGRMITGLLAESSAETITLLDAKNKRTVIDRADLEQLRESTVSLMPEKLLDEMTDQQIRDLLAYLQSDGPIPQ